MAHPPGSGGTRHDKVGIAKEGAAQEVGQAREGIRQFKVIDGNIRERNEILQIAQSGLPVETWKIRHNEGLQANKVAFIDTRSGEVKDLSSKARKLNILKIFMAYERKTKGG